MLTNALKLSFLTYLKNLGLYDYLAFGWLVLLFLLMIVLAIVIAKRSSALSLLMIVIALFGFVLMPFVIQTKLNQTQRTTETHITLVKKLMFSESLIVEGDVTNLSQKTFQKCLIQTTIIPQTELEGFRAWLLTLKPITNQSIMVYETLAPNDSKHVQVVFEDFRYSKDVNATLKAECY